MGNPKNGGKSESIQKIIMIALLYFFFVLSGIFEEKLFKNNYKVSGNPNKTTKLKDPFFSLFSVSLVSSVISVIGYTLSKGYIKNKGASPISNIDVPVLGGYYMAAKYSAEYSMQYVDYLMKVIIKSCKSASIVGIGLLYNIPIVGSFFDYLLRQKGKKKTVNYTKKDVLKVIITTISVLLFNLDFSKKGKSGPEIPYFYALVGYVLLIVSNFFDGILCLKEKIIEEDMKRDSIYEGYDKVLHWTYMVIFSVIGLLCTSASFVWRMMFNNYGETLAEILSSPELVRDIIIYGLLTSVGQLFIFIFLNIYGPLTLSIITSIRKIINILCSIIIFKKAIGGIQYISIGLATAVILWEVFDKTTKKPKKE